MMVQDESSSEQARCLPLFNAHFYINMYIRHIQELYPRCFCESSHAREILQYVSLSAFLYGHDKRRSVKCPSMK
jgi:hypothetical protein